MHFIDGGGGMELIGCHKDVVNLTDISFWICYQI